MLMMFQLRRITDLYVASRVLLKRNKQVLTDEIVPDTETTELGGLLMAWIGAYSICLAISR